MKKTSIARTFYYVLGMMTLALGLSLNAKTGLGVSPITSLPYTLSKIIDVNFGNAIFVSYLVFILIQLLLNGKKDWLLTLLQIPVSLIFTRVMNFYAAVFDFQFISFWQNILLLLLAICCTGIGAAMTLSMRLVPNPGDGIVQTLADFFHKELGLTKNLFDLINATIALILGGMHGNPLLGVGIGTVLGVLGVGRVVAFFNLIFKKKIQQQAGLA